DTPCTTGDQRTQAPSRLDSGGSRYLKGIGTGMTGAHHPDAIPTQQTGIARYMEHRRSGPAQTLEKAPWVVVVEGGQDAQARLFEPLELEGEGRSSLHPPSDAFRQVGGDAEAGDLRRAQPEQPFRLRDRLDDGPELP